MSDEIKDNAEVVKALLEEKQRLIEEIELYQSIVIKNLIAQKRMALIAQLIKLYDKNN